MSWGEVSRYGCAMPICGGEWTWGVSMPIRRRPALASEISSRSSVIDSVCNLTFPFARLEVEMPCE